MKLGSMALLTLSLAFISSSISPGLRAQDASVPSSNQVDQCMKWIKATVPNLRGPYDGDLRKLDPAHFCAGIQQGGLGGWGAVFKCGRSGEQTSGAPLRYCASFGEVNGVGAWAAGFSSSTRDGSDLLDGTSALMKDSQHAAVTFYSANPVNMESLKIARRDVQAYSFQISGWVETCRCQTKWRMERGQLYAALCWKCRLEGGGVRQPTREEQSRNIAWSWGREMRESLRAA